jgi:hypothetical protein
MSNDTTVEKRLVSTIESFYLYKNCYDDEIDQRMAQFLSDFMDLKDYIIEEFGESMPHTLGLIEENQNE